MQRKGKRYKVNEKSETESRDFVLKIPIFKNKQNFKNINFLLNRIWFGLPTLDSLSVSVIPCGNRYLVNSSIEN